MPINRKFVASLGSSDPDRDAAIVEMAYRQGFKNALEWYAIWQDGEQYVGALRRPLKSVLAEMDDKTVPFSIF